MYFFEISQEQFAPFWLYAKHVKEKRSSDWKIIVEVQQTSIQLGVSGTGKHPLIEIKQLEVESLVFRKRQLSIELFAEECDATAA